MHGLETLTRLNKQQYNFAQAERMQKLANRATRKGNTALANKWLSRRVEYMQRNNYTAMTHHEVAS